MQKRRWIILGVLALLIVLGYTFGGVSPSAQAQKLSHSGMAEADHWTVDVKVQDYRSVEGGTPAPQAYNRKALLKATVITQGKAQGSDWLQTCRYESIQKTEYSWKRLETRATLLTLWDTLLGPNGGVRSLKVRAASSSPWLQPEVLAPLNGAIWPELPDQNVAPGDSWDNHLAFQLEARELAKPLPIQWNCHWTWRPPVPGSSEAVATLDLQATPAAPVQGSWNGEVLYSVPDQRVVGARGLLKMSLTAPASQPEMSLVEGLEVNYELLRLLPGSTEKTPAASPPGGPQGSAFPALPAQTP